MPVISVPTVQADTPVSAPGNPHGTDAPTFRGQPYMVGTFNSLSAQGVKMNGIRLSGQINGQVYLDKIEYITTQAIFLTLARRIGGQNSGTGIALQPYNGANSSGPAWGFNGIESGDVSTQTYGQYITVEPTRGVIQFDYPMLLEQSGRFGLYSTSANGTLYANFHVRIVT